MNTRSLVRDVVGVLLDRLTAFRLRRRGDEAIDIFETDRFGQSLFFPVSVRGDEVAKQTFKDAAVRGLGCYTVPSSSWKVAHDALHHNGCFGIASTASFGAMLIDTP